MDYLEVVDCLDQLDHRVTQVKMVSKENLGHQDRRESKVAKVIWALLEVLDLVVIEEKVDLLGHQEKKDHLE